MSSAHADMTLFDNENVKTQETPSMVLASRAMMAKLSISILPARRNERRLAEETADRHGTDRKMISTSRNTLARAALARLTSISATARNFHYDLTLPWLDDGARVLPARLGMNYITKMREFERDFQKEIEAFIVDYPNHVSEAKLLLNQTFNPADYPGYDNDKNEVTDPNQVRNRFAFKFTITPLPASVDFRVKLSDDEVASEEERIRAEEELRYRKAALDSDMSNWAAETASRDLFIRIYDRVKHMIERLTMYHIDGDGKVQHKFHDTIVLNIDMLCELIPLLNIADNADLVAMTHRLKNELCEFQPDELRHDEAIRMNVTARAEDILKTVEGFIF